MVESVSGTLAAGAAAGAAALDRFDREYLRGLSPEEDSLEDKRARLRVDPDVYTIEPISDEYNRWVEKEFQYPLVGEQKEEARKMLSDEAIFSLYCELVPSSVSVEKFWSNYFWKAMQIERLSDDPMEKEGKGDQAEQERNENKIEKDASESIAENKDTEKDADTESMAENQDAEKDAPENVVENQDSEEEPSQHSKNTRQREE